MKTANPTTTTTRGTTEKMSDLSLSVDCVPFSLTLTKPLSGSRGTVETRDGFLVRLSDGEKTGYGEATPLPPWTETYDECEAVLGRLVGEREGRGEDVETDGKRTPAATYAVSLAAADLEARRRGVPLYVYLGGGGAREEVCVDVNATVGDTGVKETVRAVGEYVDEGYETVKLKVGSRELGEDVERVRRTDEAFDVRVRADANGSWRYDDARRFAEGVSDLDAFEYVEQPLNPDDLRAHARLRNTTDVKVALDESLARQTVEKIVKEDAADYVVVKPMGVGSIEKARRVCVDARADSVVPVVSNTVETAVGRTAAAHVAASVPVETACGLGTGALLREDLDEGGMVKDGKIRLTDTAGTGVEPEVKDAG